MAECNTYNLKYNESNKTCVEQCVYYIDSTSTTKMICTTNQTSDGTTNICPDDNSYAVQIVNSGDIDSVTTQGDIVCISACTDNANYKYYFAN